MKRMVKKIIATFFVTLLTMIGFSSPTFAAKFGSTPYDDAYQAAVDFLPSGLTVNQFLAMILAVTWPETADNNLNNVPSPMTMGRGDLSLVLYSFNADTSSSTTKQAFWHGGIGIWQIDPAGFPFHDAEDAMNTSTAARTAAQTMSELWTTTPTRSYAWSPWHACDSGACENAYQAIYQGGNVVVDHTPVVNRYGGGVWGTCNYSGSPSVTWSCFKVDRNAAQGYTTSWRYTPYDGTYTRGTGGHSGCNPVDGCDSSPLANIFYVYTASNDSKEVRYWTARQTGYSTGVQGTRPFGYDARSSVVWSGPTMNMCFNSVCP